MRNIKKVLALTLCVLCLLCSCAEKDSSSQAETADTSSESKTESSSAAPDESSKSELSSTSDRPQLKQVINDNISDMKGKIKQDDTITIDKETVGEDIAGMYDYINQTGCYPVYRCEGVEYYPMGELALDAMIEELEKAESFIFFEFYTLNEGEMWDRIYEVLKRKAAEGVEVRVMYDWLISGLDLPEGFPQQLEENGIKCVPFSEAGGDQSYDYNIRDHRKILVIDGKVAFTGGINVADAYVNITHEFGVWKDNSIKITGSAVNSFTLMCLQLWNSCSGDTEVDKYLTAESDDDKAKGYIMPFSENPCDEYLVSKSLYMSMLENAKDYIYIITPYLIPDEGFEKALADTVARGVDVRIYVPGISDLVMAGTLTKAHYQQIIESGVRIFEYNKGFIHSKVVVCDDNKAVVGTVNVDNRSFIYDFECGVYLYGKDLITDILAEFDNKEDFTEVSAEDASSNSNVGGYILKGFEGLF